MISTFTISCCFGCSTSAMAADATPTENTAAAIRVKRIGIRQARASFQNAGIMPWFNRKYSIFGNEILPAIKLARLAAAQSAIFKTG
ncbi:hypothetical protein [Duganella lactea]|uniref:hypothetical protein n=1 Tax=Duganella lactea TaxID=2692173 RepID=UPI0019292A99|nr:hypothetical protein [Duganella lactea]